MSEFILPQFQHLKREYDAAVRCNRCGFCETVCPTYTATGKETLSPRGRNQAFRNILEGKLGDAAAARDIFSTCLTCHACTNVCFAQVPVVRIMGAARKISQTPLQNALARAAFRALLFNRRALSVVLWLAFLLKRTLIPRVLRLAGVLKLISRPLAAAEDLVEEAPLSFGACPPKNSNVKGNADVALFSGCGVHYLFPGASQAIVDNLDARNTAIRCPRHSCCGLIPQSAGDVKTARELAEKNIRDFGSLRVKTVLASDDSCAGFMKSYPALLPDNPDAGSFAAKVKNLSEFLVALPPVAPRPGASAPPVKVTYHDPCQMGNGHKSFSSPRQILKNLPGVQYVELEEANECCGGAGTYSLKHPELADEVLEKKLQNIEKSGAEVVVTQAASCLLHIAYGSRKKKWSGKIRVVHLAEFLSERGST
ncbi:MAG: hypothetical protein A2901_00220 [Elusimicrobia bacterium RIFCSPLOWO2_01_FULL_54_10]|nr:MAG: hypothetical protein A2901_00220 [Elusimicrobia bacterium RIFCSPLOWO2_01_FULL_54_10]